MNWRTVLGGAALIGATALITTTVVSHQDTGHTPPAHGEERQYGIPGEAHRHLDPLIGTWDQTVRFWMGPDSEPMEMQTTATYSWIMGGRFVQGNYEGDMFEGPFQGMDIIGYDNFRKEYISLWLDNHSTSFMITRGRFDESRNELVLRGLVDDTMTGQRDRPIRTVSSFPDKDSAIYRMYYVQPDGSEYLSLEVRSTRKR